jgi:hypothetical protein
MQARDGFWKATTVNKILRASRELNQVRLHGRDHAGVGPEHSLRRLGLRS